MQEIPHNLLTLLNRLAFVRQVKSFSEEEKQAGKPTKESTKIFNVTFYKN